MGARDTGPEGLPASCEARSRDGDRGLSLQARWGSRDETTTAFLDRTGLSAYSAPSLRSAPGRVC
ncbi:hypothetical protein OIE63_16945 [Streptomyces sp. NBC_01795]|uniref:hypothetical protein n=1 Tax=Streptomyces sp. NBC_01795 TaxID=2975943 RepID=UPI002DDA60C0|nr:hypothetical protein [Streptomyces sp. NBC_01795]WSA93071.1 hypothetical protein OIE63_16945 [Streptomyces sp. NBC_01795]